MTTNNPKGKKVMPERSAGGAVKSSSYEEVFGPPITLDELQSEYAGNSYFISINENTNVSLLRRLAQALRSRHLISRAINTPSGRIVRVVTRDLDLLKSLLPEGFTIYDRVQDTIGTYRNVDTGEEVKF